MRRGSLFVFEGLDGSGISTQATRLAGHFSKRDGRPVVHTAEPSDGPVGVVVRNLLAGDGIDGQPISLRTLSLLFAADRVDHMQRLVDPALARGDSVVCERWVASSLAYQRSGIDRDWITALNAHSRRPDVTIFLRVSVEVAHRRRQAAGRREEYFQQLSTQRDVEAGYHTTIDELRAEGQRIEVVDGEQSEDEVFAAILRALG